MFVGAVLLVQVIVFNVKNGEKDPMSTSDEKDPILKEGIGSSDGIIERLQMLIGDASVSAKASAWGVPNATLSAMLKRGTDPSVRNALKIAEAENLRIEWLLTGRGQMHMQQTTGALPTHVGLDGDFVMVNDLSNVDAAAGGGAYVTDEDATGRMAFRREWIIREGLKAQALRIIRARGDSMEPTIQDGAPILVEVFAYEDDEGNVRYLHSGNTPRDVVKRDGIYVVRLDDKLLVKRLQLDMLGGLLVKSDNQTYDTLHIPASQIGEIAVIGRVVWTGRKL